MKLHYISTGCYPESGELPGTEKKIRYQINCLQGLGIDVIHHHPHPLIKNKYISYIYSEIVRIVEYVKLRYTLEKNDIVYIRREYHHLSYLILTLFKRDFKAVIETQTLEQYEYVPKKRGKIIPIIFSYYNHISFLLFEKILKNSVDGIVSVTNEITKYNSNVTHDCLQYLTLGNGINTKCISIRSPSTLTDTYHILIVANIAYWHGVDRFIHGLHEHNAHYANSRKIVLHIVGDGSELPHLMDLTNNLGLNDCVIFHGFKSGKDLDEMFDKCHIALDALACFRKGLTETSSLKSREYCARGIPFIASSRDSDFPDGWEYVQKIPDDESSIDMNLVIDFANRVMSEPEHPHKMRKYAEEHLDWIAKMRILNEFLKTL